jgi:glycosyltransferase involved in cell wall biosynthesis
VGEQVGAVDEAKVLSVIIPAHNEAQVIGRCLTGLLDGAQRDSLEIVVVCNGCHDGTSAIARSFGPSVQVLELAAASKSAALNAGDLIARHYPRFYVDADVVVTGRDLNKVADWLLDGRALAATTGLHIHSAHSSWLVRRYYRFWQSLPQIANDLCGRGVYGASEVGRRSFDRFPDAIADDMFFRSRFPRHSRSIVPGTSATVFAPRTFRGLLRRRVRVLAGNAQLSDRGHLAEGESGLRALTAAMRQTTVLDAAVYVAVGCVSRLAVAWEARGDRSIRWGADDSRPVTSDTLT